MENTSGLSEELMVLRDRFRGVLVGLAVGDALGGPLEFQPARTPENYVTDMIGGGWQRLAPGEWTDDTQMTLCIVESLLTRKVFDPDDIARRFVVWLDSGPKDIGLHTSQVLNQIRSGTSWEEASVEAHENDPESAPNGSIMRCAPLALFFFRHPDYVSSLSPVLSRITHAHPDCEWGCVLINVAITHLLAGRHVSEAIEAAYDACDDASEELKARVGYAMQSSNETSPSGWVLDTLEVALWALLHTSSFEAAVVEAVNRGADADTVGAVVGALAGARYGYTSIPQRWLEVLKERPFIVDYADRLLMLALESG